MNPFGKKYHNDFYALADVTFDIKRGETVGIIGKNGSGKSTLLKIITGVLTPSAGTVAVKGRVSALLELGTGFNMEYTGVENIYFSGTVMGFTREEMDAKLGDILAFADIGDFVYQPVKIYSSGMFLRLAFAVATVMDPEILIVDEALSVGDLFFRAKCMTRMKKMIDRGVTLLFVSHDTGSVKSLCNNAIFLNKGSMLAFDRADKVVEQYFAQRVREGQIVIAEKSGDEDQLSPGRCAGGDNTMLAAFAENADFLKRATFERIQNGKARFVNVQLLSEDMKDLQSVEYGQTVILRMCIEINADVHLLSCGYHIKDRNGVSIVNSNLSIEGKMIPFPAEGEKYVVDWKFRVFLMDGIYNICCVLSVPLDIEFGEVDFCDYVPCALQFEMQRMKTSRLYGYVHWQNDVEITGPKG